MTLINSQKSASNKCKSDSTAGGATWNQNSPHPPCLSPNHHKNNTPKKNFYRCSACHKDILEQFILKVAPNLDFHSHCLKCSECQQLLHENSTCFVRQDRVYCRKDYQKLFPTKCKLCQLDFMENDLVMKAKSNIYHTDCFKCVVCHKVLNSGDEFCIREKGIYCKADVEVVDRVSEDFNNNNIIDKNNSVAHDNVKTECGDDTSVLTSHGSCESDGSIKTPASKRSESRSRSHKSDHKATRVRTVLNEKQLYTLRTCYGANPRPDALMKEQLVEMTGLSPRVIRVWFQNKRCKDKKRTILLKQIQQQQQDKVDNCDLDETLWLKSKASMMSYSPDHQSWVPGLKLFHWKNLIDENSNNQSKLIQHQQEQHHLNYLHNSYMLSQQLLNNDNDANDLLPLNNNKDGDEEDDSIVCLKEPTHVMTSLDFADVTIT